MKEKKKKSYTHCTYLLNCEPLLKLPNSVLLFRVWIEFQNWKDTYKSRSISQFSSRATNERCIVFVKTFSDKLFVAVGWVLVKILVRKKKKKDSEQIKMQTQYKINLSCSYIHDSNQEQFIINTNRYRARKVGQSSFLKLLSLSSGTYGH